MKALVGMLGDRCCNCGHTDKLLVRDPVTLTPIIHNARAWEMYRMSFPLEVICVECIDDE